MVIGRYSFVRVAVFVRVNEKDLKRKRDSGGL